MNCDGNQSIKSGIQNMSRGGARKGAGRKPSSLTVRSREIAEKVFASGDKTPLEVMIGMLNGTVPFDKDLLTVAQSAAPYMHPRLSAVEAKVDVGYGEMSDDELDALIATAAAEAGVATGLEGEDETEG